MLEFENRYSYALHLVGQELFDLLEYNRTLTGVILNKILHKPHFIRELKKQLFDLVSKIERHIIFRLRNTHEDNVHLAQQDMARLSAQTEQLVKLIDKERKKMKFFKFLLSPYIHWLEILKNKIELYQETKSYPENMEMDYDLYLKNIDNLAVQQKDTRYHILPSWIRLFEYFFPNSLFVEFKERLEKIAKIHSTATLPSLYSILLKKQLIEKAIIPYKDNNLEDYPELFCNIDMTLASVDDLEKHLRSTDDPIVNYIERVKERLSVIDIDEALGNTGQFYEMAEQNHEQIKALSQPKKLFHFNSSSIFSRKKQQPSRQISLESQRSESYPQYEKRTKSKRNPFACACQ